PSWENHRALFEGAGFVVNNYPYYQPATHGLNFAGTRATLETLPAGAIVVLHACCHNPTGVDPTAAQWGTIIDIVRARGLIPFVDIAYQGFDRDIDLDASVVRRFAATPGPLFISNSFSKSFSLYGERVGALTVVAKDKYEAARVLSQLKRVVRANYSTPPTHGAQIIATVLERAELSALWKTEVAAMRERIRDMRKALVEKLAQYSSGANYGFILQQRGMFSYTGLTAAQVARLRKEFSVYAVDTGRICVAALNTRNVDYTARAMASVMVK